MGWFDDWWFKSRPQPKLGPNDIPKDVLQDLLQGQASGMTSKDQPNRESLPRSRFPSEGNFEEMYNELSYMLENFMGSQPSFTLQLGKPEELNARKDPGGLRDKMLDGDNKEQAIEPFQNEDQLSEHSMFGFNPHSFLHGFFHIPFDKMIIDDHDQPGCDIDLDDEVNSGSHSLDDILKEDASSNILNDLLSPYADRNMTPNNFLNFDNFISHQGGDSQSVYKYSTVTKKANADGSIETHSKKRDSDGNEETVVTRSIGDKSHTVSTRKDKDGQEETTENFVNMESDEISSFEENWKDKKHTLLRDKLLAPADKSISNDNWQDFFSSLWKPKL